MSLFKVLLQAIRERKLPMFAWSRGGSISSRCPRCRAPIALTEVAAGKHAFKCVSCGEEATWRAES